MTKTLTSSIRIAGLALGVSLLPVVASAQADMSCADYLKADAQMQAAMSAADKAAMKADPQATALDDKMRAYCKANPKASSSEAMTKAMQ